MNVPADAGAAKVRPASTPSTDAPAPANKAEQAPKADLAAQAPSTAHRQRTSPRANRSIKLRNASQAPAREVAKC